MHEYSRQPSKRTYYRFEEIEAQVCNDAIHATDPEPVQAAFVGPVYLPPSQPPIGFWRRQFRENVTSGQKKFDAAFGIALPLICFFFDPIVFKSAWEREPAILQGFRTPAYMLAFGAIMVTMASLIWGPRLKWANAFVSGFLGACFFASLSIGVVLIPFSVMGLAILIGMLGFTPLFTSFVLLRNSVRSFRAAKPLLERSVLVNCCGLVAMATAVLTYLTYLWAK